jgi:ParB family chromosome partitioning protein
MSNSRDGRRLARGLSALMSDAGLDGAMGRAQAADGERNAMQSVPIGDVVPNPDQPRQGFDEHELADLAGSIRAKGVLQPLIVRLAGDAAGRYQIVAGERRWRAVQIAGLHEIPVIVRDFADTEVLEVAIIENIQRADLNPIEEAQAYRRLIDQHGHTQEQMGAILGRSRSHVANSLRLTNLPDSVQTLLRRGDISAGHGRALLMAERPEALARTVVERGLSVRETERLAKRRGGPDGPSAAGGPSGPRGAPDESDPDTRMLEGDLSAALRMGVRIRHGKPGEGGILSVRYRDLDQLDALCELLSHGIERERG